MPSGPPVRSDVGRAPRARLARISSLALPACVARRTLTTDYRISTPGGLVIIDNPDGSWGRATMTLYVAKSWLLVSILVACPANALSNSPTAPLTGVPRIVDGDTVEIAGTKIRLEGIDAPETDQLCLNAHGQRWACGIEARDQLVRHAGGRAWTCKEKEKDRYGRTVATCFVGAEDIDRWMVREGWALAFLRYSRLYEAEEAAARAAHAGLWAGAFIAPWDWRSRNERTVILGATTVPMNAPSILLGATSSSEAPDPSCLIKGNVNRQGECIYHLPGNRWYAKVSMSAPGRRWFCTAAEAEAAGCRAPK